MSKNLKILYAVINTLAQPGICFVFILGAFYVDFYGALWQNSLMVALAYALITLAVVSTLCSIFAGWKWALQNQDQSRAWKGILWFPWVIFAVCLVSLVALLVILALKKVI